MNGPIASQVAFYFLERGATAPSETHSVERCYSLSILSSYTPKPMSNWLPAPGTGPDQLKERSLQIIFRLLFSNPSRISLASTSRRGQPRAKTFMMSKYLGISKALPLSATSRIKPISLTAAKPPQEVYQLFL